MANITISDLRTTDLRLSDSENYLNDLTDDELKTYGGSKNLSSSYICRHYGSKSCAWAKAKEKGLW
ncbi:hypothetical protein CEP14_13560 [Cylindrospermopsis raciborskii C04]|uniref:Uncharacterized protein n=1 Tax=Cylindrospermopsis raciborskii C07 TaxID=2014886 RepID=A0ABX4WIS0_9CYAN|nr:hypothetical protein [Cylindrospermopsis raciborskii]PNJ93227.1 hypothetical protein CEP15_15165 [Cylindrospermopsis raciborskii C07]PNJ93537.1 hypothetical protein CEP14_13560 [Cylindrospermopsis raciborskii C04]PNJ94607.1 hypothetical protein CEP13_10440 [Cylindrospermopsis raciborskii C03]